MNAQSAIARARRDLTLTTLIKSGLLIAVVFGMFVAPMLNLRSDGTLLLVVVGIIWLVLSFQSMKGSRMAAASPGLIASGQYEEAEKTIDGALRSFSLFRTVKLMSLHHLALLRHAQRRYQEAAALCRELLDQRLGAVSGVGKQSRLILADALLEMGDLNGAHETLSSLYRHRLSLSEAMNLLQVEADYQARTGAWTQLAANLPSKVQLAELLPAPAAARVQALLALAAKKTDQPEWSDFLRRRAELLADPQDLARQRPVLWELWENPQPS
jgi:hypothetical protein